VQIVAAAGINQDVTLLPGISVQKWARGETNQMNKRLQVGQFEKSGKQVTVDSEGLIVAGVPENGTVQLQSGERIEVKDGHDTIRRSGH